MGKPVKGAWTAPPPSGRKGEGPREAFADLLGVHRTYVGGLERGERNVPLRALERYAARLGVDALGLLAGG